MINRLLKTELYKITPEKWVILTSACMIIFSIGFIAMQKTAMNYTVGIDRVVFLPMVMYGIVIAALISVLVSEEFEDSFIKNKIIVNGNRSEIYNGIAVRFHCLINSLFNN